MTVFKKFWTQQEDDLLRELIGTHPFSYLAQFFPGRSRCALIGRSKRIGAQCIDAFPWDDSHTERLRALVARGQTGVECAKELGLTPARIYYFAKRNNIVFRTKSAPRKLQPKIIAKGKSYIAKGKSYIANRMAPTHESRFCSLIDLRDGNCHFPLGDPLKGDFSFCGAGAPVGRPYCEAHYRLCYTPYARRRAQDTARAPVTSSPP